MGYEIALKFCGQNTRNELIDGIVMAMKECKLFAKVTYNYSKNDWINDIKIDIDSFGVNYVEDFPMIQIIFGYKNIKTGNSIDLESCFSDIQQKPDRDVKYAYFVENYPCILPSDVFLEMKKYFSSQCIEFEYAEL
jgi:hypothetical protein